MHYAPSMPRVVIAAGSQLAADAGAAIADIGGNAVDALLAATLVSLCTDPGIVAPGAGGFVSILPTNGRPEVIDGYAAMPGLGGTGTPNPATIREVFIDYGGGLSTIVGESSVAVPGAIAAFGVAAERHGRVPWRELVQPAIEAASKGFPLPPAAAEYLQFSHELVFGWDQASRVALHHDDGTPLSAGDTVHMADLPDALEMLATEGPSSFYTGSLAQRMVSAMEEVGGLLTREDLAAYRAEIRQPIEIEYGDWAIATNPAPAVGGAATMAQVLLADPTLEGLSQEGLTQFAAAQAAVFGFREEHIDHAVDRNAQLERLLELARDGTLLSSPSTAHNSAVDSDGLACSITVSAGYGSGWVVPGTGMFMNNCLGELELNPAGFLKAAPGSRLVSNMAPTVGRRNDGAVLAIGSPGAARITSAVATVLLAVARDGLSLEDAVLRPRFHVEKYDGAASIAHEVGVDMPAIPGYLDRPFPDRAMYFGGAHSAMYEPSRGLVAAPDPRRAGACAYGGTND
ncbi:MAG: gamma-glutamyltransferase family protein [Acidimicrobiia bacterium]|nr:gamma-glutamyltransferase family protein [Acidimicrobiia bacterium]